MSTGHTPGPWNVEWVVDGAFHINGQSQGDNCVIAARAPFPARHFEFAANARLIAAAPDYFDAAENLSTDYSELDGDDAGYVAVTKAAFDALMKAHRSATGAVA